MLTTATERTRAARRRPLSTAYASDADRELLGLVCEQTARFLAREVDSAQIDREGTIPTRVREAAAAAGLFGLTIDEAHGGLGMSLKATGSLVQQIARTDRSVAIMIGLHAGLGTRALMVHGTAEQKQRWLPALASGERVASFAATEAGAGSDLGSIRTTAIRSGSALRLDGEKSYVTNGGFAGLFTVLARTPQAGGSRGQSLLCVPRETPGVEIGAEKEKLGIRGSSTVTVRFDGAQLSMDNVVGEPGKGIALAHEALAWGRTLMSAGCIGTAEAALTATRVHLHTRRQFGRALDSFGASRAQLAGMAARIFAMESLVRDTAARDALGEDIEIPSAMAKVFCSETTFEVCDRAVQLHGALGFIEPAGVARLLRDCRITRIFEGANDVLLVRLGAAMLTRGPAHENQTPGASAMAHECSALDTRLRSAVRRVRRIYGIRAIEHQLVLQRLARAAIALRAAHVSRLRADEDPRAETQALATLAVDALVDEGDRWLDALGKTDVEESEVAAVLDAQRRA